MGINSAIKGLNTFHNSPFTPAIVGKITALSSVTLEQGL